MCLGSNPTARWREFNLLEMTVAKVVSYNKHRRKQEAQRATYSAPQYNVPAFRQISQGRNFCLLIGLKNSNFSTSSTKFVFFRPIGKTRWPPWPLIGWDIFHFSSETAERNSTKLDRKQDGRRRWDLASCRVSLNSVQRFHRRSGKCLSQSEARAAILFFRSARKTQTW